ncbi:molybdopterin-dependent oxidoreductase [Escherichia coli]|nr:molybdopterin-dependent oxidoreductase [Escherichia coli]
MRKTVSRKYAAWAEKLTGIDAETIRGLARQMAANRTQIIAGWCVQRMQHGEQWAWMIVVLAAMLGQIGPADVVVLVLAGTTTGRRHAGA